MVFSELFKIIGIGLITVVCYVIVKPIKPELAVFVGLAGSCVILVFCIDAVIGVINTITGFVEKAGLDSNLLSLILKIIGIGYLTEFASNICIDAGNNSVSDKILFAGKVCILAVSLPIITNLLNIIIEILL